MSLFASFQDAPIKRKLMLIGLITSGLALLFISLILIARNWVEWRDHTVSDMMTYANIISTHTAPAMLFDDRNAAAESLSALAANPDIVDAVIYDKAGRMFARFSTSRNPSGAMPQLKPGAYLFTLRQLVVSAPIRFKGEVMGTLYLESDLRGLYADIRRDTALTIVAVLCVFLAVAFLFVRLQKAIVNPILDLANGMRKVSTEQDYAVRVAVHGKDEVGILARTFNTMLERIQQHDAELAQHRTHLEREVAQRTASLTNAQRIAHLGNWEWDIVNNTLDWSDEIYRIFGLTPQQFGATYDAFLSAVHPEDRPLVDTKVREAVELGSPYSIDHRILLPDGSVRYVHEEAEVFLAKDGRPLRMLGTVQDITQDKATTEALRKMNVELNLFRTLLDNSSDAIEVIDPITLRFLDMNETTCRDLGYSREELLSMSIFDIDPSLSQDSKKMIEEQMQKSGTACFEGIHRRKDGSTFAVEVSMGSVNLDKPYGLCVVRDITERKRASQAIEESERKFRAILDAAVDGILLADVQDHKFINGNRAICDMLGYQPEELYRLGVEDIHPAEALPEVFRQFERQLKGEIRVARNLPVKRKDGSVFLADVSSSPTVLAGRPVLVGLFHDVTERKQAEDKIRQLNEELDTKVKQRTQQLLEAQEELVRNEKLAVLGQIAGSVGHELRNPLGVMSNAVYFLQTVLSDADETTREYLNIIKDEIAGSERIVSDLLDSVRTQPPHPEAVGVAELIGQTLRKCSVPSSVTVKLDIPAMLPPLRVDAMQILQVFRNLISNGVEAMPEGGTLEIRAVENRQDGTVTVSVRDSGIGMTPEQLGKLFQPLFTTKVRGIGLGLVVVKNLTQANGGTVDVRSEPGKGTTFTITLPSAG
ncbi:MAG: PAS domain S-box protein [Sulfuricella sp.]|nr:PAS domain S-box protein [Sulfuricella sp.]